MRKVVLKMVGLLSVWAFYGQLYLKWIEPLRYPNGTKKLIATVAAVVACAGLTWAIILFRRDDLVPVARVAGWGLLGVFAGVCLTIIAKFPTIDGPRGGEAATLLFLTVVGALIGSLVGEARNEPQQDKKQSADPNHPSSQISGHEPCE